MSVLNIQLKHIRKEDSQDKYFIVYLIINTNKYEVGYIEKSFNEAEFKSKLGAVDFEIKNIIEFKSKKEYLIYKEKYADKVNF